MKGHVTHKAACFQNAPSFYLNDMSNNSNNNHASGKDTQVANGGPQEALLPGLGLNLASGAGSGSGSGSGSTMASTLPSQTKPSPFKLDLDAKTDPDFMRFVTEESKRRGVTEVQCHKMIDDDLYQRLARDYSLWRVSLASGTAVCRLGLP